MHPSGRVRFETYIIYLVENATPIGAEHRLEPVAGNTAWEFDSPHFFARHAKPPDSLRKVAANDRQG